MSERCRSGDEEKEKEDWRIVKTDALDPTRPAPVRDELEDGGGGSQSPSGQTAAAPKVVSQGVCAQRHQHWRAKTLLQAFESREDLSRRRPGGAQTRSGRVLEAPRGRQGGLQRLPGGIC